jgi:riboflavin kinase/FMN adenylyltransferase
MRVYDGSETLPEHQRGCVLTVGNFDGVHRGHEALLRAVTERAATLGCAAAVYTFHPHPRRVLFPEDSPPLLMTWTQLADALEQAGIEVVIRERFTAEFASLSAEAFLTQILHHRVRPQEIFVGRDFHFGKGRGGSDNTLVTLAPALGIRTVIIPQVVADTRDVSSTRVREALARGDVTDARLCLGRPYAIWGRVVVGDGRGRTLGFPTANMEPENEIVPLGGVYATSVRLFDGERPAGPPHPAVTNIGTRPTFATGRMLTEAHLFDFDQDLYDRRIAIAFHARIRAERRFPDAEALVRQIREDAAQARRLLAAEGV